MPRYSLSHPGEDRRHLEFWTEKAPMLAAVSQPSPRVRAAVQFFRRQLVFIVALSIGLAAGTVAALRASSPQPPLSPPSVPTPTPRASGPAPTSFLLDPAIQSILERLGAEQYDREIRMQLDGGTPLVTPPPTPTHQWHLGPPPADNTPGKKLPGPPAFHDGEEVPS